MVTKLSVFLQVDPSSEEADLEGAARIGDRIYWISSHGRNAKGKFRLSRAQFFATTATVTNGVVRLEPTGRPYHRLLTDLTQDPKLARFQLWNAAQMPPKSPGALNIEGLAATASGQLLIGFRNPIPGGQALIVPLLNPGELLELKSARFGDPVLLNLQGLGIRSMTRCGGAYLIVAGRFDEGGESRLFEWKGGIDVPRPLEIGRLHGLNPEVIACLGEHADREALFVTSDDGMRNLDGKPCKQLKDPRQKFFRGLRLELPEESQ